MNVEPPETLVIIESIVYKSNGFAIAYLVSLSGQRKVELETSAKNVDAEQRWFKPMRLNWYQ